MVGSPTRRGIPLAQCIPRSIITCACQPTRRIDAPPHDKYRSRVGNHAGTKWFLLRAEPRCNGVIKGLGVHWSLHSKPCCRSPGSLYRYASFGLYSLVCGDFAGLCPAECPAVSWYDAFLPLYDCFFVLIAESSDQCLCR